MVLHFQEPVREHQEDVGSWKAHIQGASATFLPDIECINEGFLNENLEQRIQNDNKKST